jgi:hypothetical protein
MRRCVTDGLDRAIVVTIQRLLNLLNSFVKIFLQADEFISHQDVLNFSIGKPRDLIAHV